MKEARRILLLGGTGRLGMAIARHIRLAANASIDACGSARETGPSSARPAPALFAPSRIALALDTRIPLEAAERWIETWKPEVIVNCIAASDVDRCEHEPLEAIRINTDLPGALAKAARRANVHLVHFSTDFVFDGELRRPYREDDPAAPLSVYGESKLHGEKAIASENPSHWIFRISWLYGGRERNLAATLLDPANAGRTIALSVDRIGVPNPVQLLAREIVHAIGYVHGPLQPADGVYHLSCRGQASWHEFGREFVAQAIDAGCLAPGNAPRIEAIHEQTMERPARRPPWSVLDASRYETTFERPLPDWRAAITLALQRAE
ncbi:MAG: dTDP-4-dehydrorhamnose reductase [Burkholderiaceae bacterium]|nr:dTDP-4-dehydrorhamnose reductase [Burkholderiaceae bacterium]